MESFSWEFHWANSIMGYLIRNTLLQLSALERLITVSRIFVAREESFDNVIPGVARFLKTRDYAIETHNPKLRSEIPFETFDFRQQSKKKKKKIKNY